MPIPTASASRTGANHGSPTAVLAWMMLLVPALGVPSELMLQDTLKSALVSFGVLIAALVFFWQQRLRTEPLKWHGLVWLPLALMAYALGSMAWSHTYLAGVEAIRWFILSLLLWLGLNTFTRENLPNLLWGIHIGAVVACVWTALQFWFDFGLFPQGPQPASTFINRNFFAEYVVCALPFSVWLMVRQHSPRWLIALAVSVALEVVAIMMTGTRSALAALLVLGVVFSAILVKYHKQCAFWHLAHIHKALIAIIFIALTGIMGAIPSGNPQVIAEKAGTTALQRSFVRMASMAKASEYTDGSFSIRSQMWMATARMMLANPLTGVGAGAWEVQIPLYQRTYTVLETDYYAHNEFLQWLSEYGVVVGGLVSAFLLAYLLHAAGSTWQLRGADVSEAPLRAFTLASLLALLIVSNAGFPWHLAGCGALLAQGLAILAGSDARLGQRERFFASSLRWRPVYSRSAFATLVCGTVLAGYVTWQAAQVERKLVRAIELAISLRQPQRPNAPSWDARKAELLKSMREGIAINPHYRKLTSEVGDQLTANGDWENVVYIWESIAKSRPQIAAVWSILALTYSRLGHYDKALQTLKEVQRLKPDSTAILTLEIQILSNTGYDELATQKLRTHFSEGRYDYDMLQTGYALGYKTHNFALAIQSLELRNKTWPEQAADGYFRLGKLYAAPALHDETKALAAFKSGLAAVPTDQKENFLSQLPPGYRDQM